MVYPFCDVIGCCATADRFYADGHGPTERLCDLHWKDLVRTDRSRALAFELVDPDRLKVEAIVRMVDDTEAAPVSRTPTLA